MGILNVTPDSFFDGGRYADADAALGQLKNLIADGADIIDIGGESSRPGSERISVEEELVRVKPVLAALRQVKSEGNRNFEFSIDTTKPQVAREAVQSGVLIINDISALRFDPQGMTALLREFPQVKVVLMHMLGEPKTMQMEPRYHDVVREVGDFFEERLDWIQLRGIHSDRVILDPGIGFGKRLEHNIELLRALRAIKERFKLPVMVGVSRKSMISQILGNAPPEERLEGSLAIALWCAYRGVDYLRVHDVAATSRALGVWRALSGI
ncbi:MAG: dihydropteroate synthase [Elusimicrobia bacterium]|nr:dihydropteroate synthase [Elusimicrobiota bacterium]